MAIKFQFDHGPFDGRGYSDAISSQVDDVNKWWNLTSGGVVGSQFSVVIENAKKEIVTKKTDAEWRVHIYVITNSVMEGGNQVITCKFVKTKDAMA